MGVTDPTQALARTFPQREAAETEHLGRVAGRVACIGGWRVELNPTRLRWSPETFEIHEELPGVSPDVERALSYYAPEHQPTIRRAFADCIEGGKSFDEVLQLVTAKGKSIWVRAIGEAVSDPSGTVVAVEGAVQDITQLVAMRDEADGLARRLGQTLECISDAFFLLDENWRFSFMNAQAERLLGRQREMLEGKILWDEFPETRGSVFEDSYRSAIRDGSAVRFQEYYPPLLAWFDVDAYPTSEGLAVYFRDITGRKQAEEEVRIHNERFRLVAKATNDVIRDWDLIGDTIWWNDNLKTLFGHDPADVEPGAASWTSRIHPDDADRVLEGIRAAIDGSASTWATEYRFLHKEGHALTIIDRGFVIRDESGKALRMVGSMLDISPQCELESRLRQAQKLEAIGQLTGGVAHDFNNLLTVILGSAELLSEELADQHRSRLLAEMISTAAQRGAELTSRLLAFARKQPLQPRLLDLNDLVAGTEALLRRTLGENIDFKINWAEDLWKVEVDPAQLEAAILNLALNARDATSQSLAIDLANATLDEVEVAPCGDVASGAYVLLTVSDTGHGIAPEVLPRVFEPFFTTKGVGKGSGLGLSMVHGFVNQSGGFIQIHSEVGKGTAVKLFFPRSYKSGSPAPDRVEARVAKGGNELILVVEDDALVRRHLTGLLEGLGYRVLQATDGNEAISVLMANSGITLLFTDVVMPGGMNGDALARRALQIHPGLKVLFTSGYSQDTFVHYGRLDPGVALLSKPYNREELATRLRTVLQY